MIIVINLFIFFLVSCVKGRPWWPMQSPNREERRERLRGEGDKIESVDLRFERRKAVGFLKGRKKQVIP